MDLNFQLYEHQNQLKNETYRKYIKLTQCNILPFSNKGIKSLSDEQNLSFEKKLDIFKNKIKSIKNDLGEGCCYLKVTRDFFLEESISQFYDISIYKVR